MKYYYIIAIFFIVLASYRIHQINTLTTQIVHSQNTSLFQNITSSLPYEQEVRNLSPNVTSIGVQILDKDDDNDDDEKNEIEEKDKESNNELNDDSTTEDHPKIRVPLESQNPEQQLDSSFVTSQFFNKSYSVTQDQIQKVDHILNTTISKELVYNISQFNQDEKLYSMNTLFPLITEYNEEFKEYYTYRQIYFKWNINSEAYRLHKQYTDFPDSSYYWVYPKGEEPKERHVLFGTFYVQHEIWKHQFPETCQDKKFLIVPLISTGMGSIIHLLPYALTLALETNRILIVKPILVSYWGDREFCDPDNNSILCYLASLTNCTVSDEDIQRSFNNNTEFISSTHAHILTYFEVFHHPSVQYVYLEKYHKVRKSPRFITSFLKGSSMREFDVFQYWRFQAAAFLTRLNEKTVSWIHEYEKEKCKDCDNEYDISLNIRHADKGSEMELISANVYKEAINIFTSLGMKDNYSIYVNADDQESVDIIHKLPHRVAFFNHTRYNFSVDQNRQLKHVALMSFANLYNQIRADHTIGTIESNWSRLIYELKMTVGMKSDGYILEVGEQYCISFSNCLHRNTQMTYYYFTFKQNKEKKQGY